ncbi:hypothetical protein J5N97_011566 [Dioscorea zingiberensis]|uniref:Uncharacterized protein n=1 Tax=Dioscorea zingiberensis TaxID=325984 RepID=A0A9D5HNV3_9LILI|nr:hypothetical protein J5N97_011566 [Dioscorea zingiberensis]
MMRMARIGGLLVCILILAMDIVAGILGNRAAGGSEQGMAPQGLVLVQCVDNQFMRPIVWVLAAAVLLAIAHATANLLGGCTCICSKEEFDRIIGNRQEWLQEP